MPEEIPMPADPTAAAERAAHLRILDADPRTAGSANRPSWLVARVLREARGTT
ncbi:MAG TPA: hypothetical protein VF316_25310 [Polyangiaceae bacterium]